jgi:hypothetical protein
MKHIHSELIKRWADDTSLVRLTKFSGDWNVCKEHSRIPWWEDYQYFLVCEKHVDVALHWLNGGKIEYRNCTTLPWGQVGCYLQGHTIDAHREYRIKPKLEKVKIWVGVIKYGFSGATYVPMDTMPTNDFYLTNYTWSQTEVDKEIV